MIVTSRRSLIIGIASLIAAPSLVRATSLMPIKGSLLDPWVLVCGGSYNGGSAFNNINKEDVPSCFRPDLGSRELRLKKWHELTSFQQCDHLNMTTGKSLWVVKRASSLRYI